MMEPLITVNDLLSLQNKPENTAQKKLHILDCRFKLGGENAEFGRQQYHAGHIPGAHYADLNKDLSGPHMPGQTGRHPLPDKPSFTKTLQHWGIEGDTPVICYDDSGGCFAARAWWLLKWAGVENASVLDGGFSAWKKAQLPLQTTPPEATSHTSQFLPQFNDKLHVDASDVIEILARAPETNARTIIDARGADRFRGENETIDPIAGHIPTALCMPFSENLDENGFFKSSEALKTRFEPYATDETIIYCGSGVTACHNILACITAGLPWPKLYPGSWSDWITDTSRPMALGPDTPKR